MKRQVPIVKASLPAALDPDFNIVECLAGCGDAKNKVVYYAPRLSSQTGLPYGPAGVTKIAATAPTGSEAAIITCVAGCYGGTAKTYAANPAPAAMQRASLEHQPATASVVPSSASLDEPKPMKLAKAKPRRPRVRQLALKTRQPSKWRTAAHLAGVRHALPPRAWRTVVRY